MATTLSRYQPQTAATRLPDMVDRLFRESFVMPTFFDSVWGGTSRPSLPVNLYETGDGYTLQAALPGINPDNVEIQVVGRDLSIKGRFESWAPENARWIWQGMPNGEFFETYSLPVDVEGNKVEANYEHGILSISLPKAEHAKPKSIQVSVKK